MSNSTDRIKQKDDTNEKERARKFVEDILVAKGLDPNITFGELRDLGDFGDLGDLRNLEGFDFYNDIVTNNVDSNVANISYKNPKDITIAEAIARSTTFMWIDGRWTHSR